MIRLTSYFLCLAIFAALAGCGGGESEEQQAGPAPTPSAPPEPTPEAVENPETVTLEDGLSYETLVRGIVTDTVQEGDSPVFDVELAGEQGEEIWAGKFQFEIASGEAIPGFDRGVRGMQIGEVRRIHVPWQLGYGEQGHGDIGAKENLVFRVELLRIENETRHDEAD